MSDPGMKLNIVKTIVNASTRQINVGWTLIEYDPAFIGYEAMDGTIHGTKCTHGTSIIEIGPILISNWSDPEKIKSLIIDRWIEYLEPEFTEKMFHSRTGMQNMGVKRGAGIVQYESRNDICKPFDCYMYLWDSNNQEWLVRQRDEPDWRSLMQMILEL